MKTVGTVIDKVLANPIAGLAPWIVYSLVEGKGRLELSASLAFGVALAILLINWLRGSAPKLLEYADVVFFGGVALFVAVATDGQREWLELWGGEIANLALVVIAVGSILIRKPFTLAYAKEETPEEYWDTPQFLRANYIITGAWALAFIVEAASGWYGDAVLGNSNDIWTGWVIQTAALLIAVQFTLWYPARVEAQGAIAAGESTTPPPPITAFFAQITPLIAVAGIIALFVGDVPVWVGIALIVVGVGLTKVLSSPKPVVAA